MQERVLPLDHLELDNLACGPGGDRLHLESGLLTQAHRGGLKSRLYFVIRRGPARGMLPLSR